MAISNLKLTDHSGSAMAQLVPHMTMRFAQGNKDLGDLDVSNEDIIDRICSGSISSPGQLTSLYDGDAIISDATQLLGMITKRRERESTYLNVMAAAKHGTGNGTGSEFVVYVVLWYPVYKDKDVPYSINEPASLDEARKTWRGYVDVNEAGNDIAILGYVPVIIRVDATVAAAGTRNVPSEDLYGPNLTWATFEIIDEVPTGSAEVYNATSGPSVLRVDLQSCSFFSVIASAVDHALGATNNTTGIKFFVGAQ